MKLSRVNKLTIVNRFVLETLHRNSNCLDIITRKTKLKLKNLKDGRSGKEPNSFRKFFRLNVKPKLFSNNRSNWKRGVPALSKGSRSACATSARDKTKMTTNIFRCKYGSVQAGTIFCD